MDIILPPFEDIDDDGNYIGNDPQFMKNDEPQIAGYLHFYIKDDILKRKLIPIELKDAFMEKFGHDLLNADENEVDEFVKNSKQK
jgi:oligoribonuclease (3'-5' exoribonuclease)